VLVGELASNSSPLRLGWKSSYLCHHAERELDGRLEYSDCLIPASSPRSSRISACRARSADTRLPLAFDRGLYVVVVVQVVDSDAIIGGGCRSSELPDSKNAHD
jgi:hypothetical protein